MDVRVFGLGPLQTNCYLLLHEGRALAIDPGGDPAPVIAALERASARLEHILNTHFHLDHIGGNAALAKATGAPILASQADDYLLQTELGAGGFMGLPLTPPFDYQPLAPGERTFLDATCQILSTPGHSPGSLSFYFPLFKMIFVGDLLFYRSVGRTDFPGGDFQALQRSVVETIFALPEDVLVYSGHGQQTSVGSEKAHNPFFNSY
jgi:glyoxylase-like metal-dependent hydrolase (beta-lactamase superfamily II)